MADYGSGPHIWLSSQRVMAALTLRCVDAFGNKLFCSTCCVARSAASRFGAHKLMHGMAYYYIPVLSEIAQTFVVLFLFSLLLGCKNFPSHEHSAH